MMPIEVECKEYYCWEKFMEYCDKYGIQLEDEWESWAWNWWKAGIDAKMQDAFFDTSERGD